MDASTDALKKKLQSFLSEMLKMGMVEGFKHFATYVRGKEELSISIVNTPRTSGSSSASSEVSNPMHRRLSVSESLTSQNLPYDTRTLMLSQRTQMQLSGMEERGVGLPPASPSDEESLPLNEDTTIFLIAGYSRYSCPYVWVRTNHERLVKLTGNRTEKDNPLRLKSTAKWADSDVYIWDVVAELVRLCTYPPPQNPFEVDLDFLQSLPLPQRVLTSAAVASLLQKILLHTPEDKIYVGKVFEEHQAVVRLHLAALRELAASGGLPVLQQYQQQQQQQQQPARPQPSSARRPGLRHHSGPGVPPQPGPQASPAQYGGYGSYGGGFQPAPSHF